MIMAKQHARYRKTDEVPSVSLPRNSCAISVFLFADEVPALRVTGVYLPPSTRPRVEVVEMLTDIRSIVRFEESEVGHLLGGATQAG